MKIYTQEDIDRVFDWFESQDDQAGQLVQELDHQQPALLAYLFSDAFEIFTSNEKELLIFATLVIYYCSKQELGDRLINEEVIQQAEEKNYELQNESLNYPQQIDLYFQHSPQEDLLSFVEDLIQEDDDEEDEFSVKTESRLPLFITLKTVIDVLTGA